MPKLGVNIDHIATLRQARRGFDPDPVAAVDICERAGADSIVAHLREDRRHINEGDILRLRKAVRTRLNLEMSLNPKIIQIALDARPDEATLVPEKRLEITTEGGLDVARHFRRVRQAVDVLQKRKITVSLFVDPVKPQIEKALESGAAMVELHTGCYDHASTRAARTWELQKIKTMTRYARSLGLRVNAGHGLKYHNTGAVARVPGIEELNIGHSIIARAVFVGLENAVREMVKLVK
jgi:pyridoxine 5-phosphate synthase